MTTGKEKITFYADPDVAAELAKFDSGARTRVINKLLRAGLEAVAEDKRSFTVDMLESLKAPPKTGVLASMERLRQDLDQMNRRLGIPAPDPYSVLMDRIEQLEQSNKRLFGEIEGIYTVLQSFTAPTVPVPTMPAFPALPTAPLPSSVQQLLGCGSQSLLEQAIFGSNIPRVDTPKPFGGVTLEQFNELMANLPQQPTPGLVNMLTNCFPCCSSCKTQHDPTSRCPEWPL